MLFHWCQVYAALRGQASLARGDIPPDAALDLIFTQARALVPEVFAPSRPLPTDPELQARFGVVVPLLAAAMLLQPDAQARQQLAEGFIARLDIALREAGVGDVGVGKRIRAFAGALNGRLQRYMPLLATHDRKGLETALLEHGVAGHEALLSALLPQPQAT